MTSKKLYEATVIVPTSNFSEYRQLLQARTVAAFGGMTVTTCYGYWADVHDEIIAEPVEVWTIAMEDTQRNTDYLYGIAEQIKRELGEEAVYVKFPDQHVEII